MEQSDTAIIIPAYNEEKTIESVVKKVKTYGVVIVVNDASTDRTAALAEKCGAYVVTHSANKGYDEALNTGFKAANDKHSKYVITFDADGQHDPRSLKKYIELLNEGADLVIGIRPQTARIAEKLFAIVTRKLYGIKDPLCGLKGYKMSLYNERGYFDSYGSIGTELALYGVKNNCICKQIPIQINRREGTSRFGRIIKANHIILRALFFSFLK